MIITEEIMLANKSLTERDRSVIAKALCYTLCAVDSLPPEKQNASDRNHMMLLFRAMLSIDSYAAGVESHTGRCPDVNLSE